jgi:phage terminase Nu1 subunit (DNA packaging protein)
LSVFRKILANGHPSPTYWWRARIAGRVVCRSTGETSRAKAQKSAATEIARLRQEASAILDPSSPSTEAKPAPAPAAAAPADTQDEKPSDAAPKSPQPDLFPESAPAASRIRLSEPQAKIAGLLRDAAAGRLPWLAQAIGDAGYRRGRAAVIGATELATLMSVSRQTIHAWTTKGCPRTTTPAGSVVFDVAAVAGWVYARGREELEIANRRAREAGNDAKKRDDEAKADLRELDLAQRRGAVIETEEHWRILLEVANRFVQAFRARPAAWATGLQGATAAVIRQTIERDLALIFAELRRPAGPANVPADALSLVRQALEGLTTDSDPPPPPPAPPTR